MTDTRIGRMCRPRATWLILGAIAAFAFTACTDLTSLEQSNPGQLSAGTIYVPANAQLLVNGAVGDFECAFSRYVVGSGILSDELTNAISQTTNIDYDRRTIQTNQSYGTGTCNGGAQQPPIYTPLSTARASADTIVAKLEGWTDAEVPNRTKLIARAAAYAGYSLVLLGEGMCSASINVGPELSPADLFAEAKTRFDKAIAAASASADAQILAFATLGRARAELDLGDLAAAAADAATITDPTFVVNISTDATNARRQNMIYVHTVQNFFSSVDPSFRGLTFGGVNDPRVTVTNSGRVGTAGTPMWTSAKATSFTSPIAVAKWAEARLIVAENLVATNDLNGATAIINELHTRAGIPAYDNTGQSAAQVLAQVLEERRRELFLEGHRLGDVRHYDLPLVPAPNSTYQSGGEYGAQRCFPLPDVERINNPNIG